MSAPEIVAIVCNCLINVILGAWCASVTLGGMDLTPPGWRRWVRGTFGAIGVLGAVLAIISLVQLAAGRLG